MIRVLYFASLRERLGTSSEDVSLPDLPTSVNRLAKYLASRGEPWHEISCAKNLRVAVNQVMVPMGSLVHDGDEIAFFPPVTGG
jgi:molybdopterin synthase sulfur carrier subunit